MFSRFFSWLRRKPGAPLSRKEAELVSLVRNTPDVPLQGDELGMAETLVGRGVLRRAGPRRFVLTERGVIAYRSSRLG